MYCINYWQHNWDASPENLEIFPIRPEWSCGPPSLLYSSYRVVALTTHPDLVPKLNNEQRYRPSAPSRLAADWTASCRSQRLSNQNDELSRKFKIRWLNIDTVLDTKRNILCYRVLRSLECYRRLGTTYSYNLQGLSIPRSWERLVVPKRR
jgi:hypothetical protein